MSKRDEWRKRVTAMHELPPGVRLVAIALSEHMGYHDLENAFPGTFSLAEATGFNERTVKKYLRVLREDVGVIERTSEGGWSGAQGRMTASTYRGVMVPLGSPRRSAAKMRAEAAERKNDHEAERAGERHPCPTCPSRGRHAALVPLGRVICDDCERGE